MESALDFLGECFVNHWKLTSDNFNNLILFEIQKDIKISFFYYQLWKIWAVSRSLILFYFFKLIYFPKIYHKQSEYIMSCKTQKTGIKDHKKLYEIPKQ